MPEATPVPAPAGGLRPADAATGVRHAVGRAPAPRVNSAALFGDAQEVEIVHGRDIYRLRITSLGRLILTK